MSSVNVRELFSESCRGTPPPIECAVPLEAMVREAQKAIKYAGQARSSLQKFNDALATKLDMEPATSVVIGPIKQEHRILQKAIARYDGDVSQVSDVSRSRIRLEAPSQVKEAKDVLASADFRHSLLEKGITILAVEDSFEKPKKTGWRGLVIKIEIDLGKGRSQKAETVMIPKGWFPDYERTHTYFENSRAIKDMARAQGRELSDAEKAQIFNYEEMSREIHDRLAHTDGYAQLETRARTPALALVNS